jgi:uncharacterized protein (TIGR02594 family)
VAKPKWLSWAEGELGVRETPGPKSTPRVIEYRSIGKTPIAGDDSVISWCAIFVNAALEASSIRGSGNAAARGFMKWGRKLDRPLEGCLVVLATPGSTWQGHVGFYVGETATHVRLLGGNQGDAVSRALFNKSRILGYRWPDGVPVPAGGPISVAGGGDVNPSDR